MRQIDVVPYGESWMLVWIVDDVHWARWCATESTWVQITQENFNATVWHSEDLAEEYLATHWAAIRHARFVVNPHRSVSTDLSTHTVCMTGA